MKMTYNVRSLETTIPPRCRKERFVEKENKLTINIKEVTPEDVKEIFIVKSYDYEPRKIIRYKGMNYIQLQDRRTNYREEIRSDNPLWVNQTVGSMKSTWLEWLLGIRFEYNTPFKSQAKKIRERASKILIVGNDLYRRCTEPYYTFITFGLGRNHGGTFLNLNFTDSKQKKVEGFPATDRQGAIKATLKIAENRGDTEYFDLIRDASDEIIVLSDDAVKKEYTYNL